MMRSRVVKRTLESGLVVPGGGCVETALSIYLENFATTLGTREQLAIAEFAEALACDSTDSQYQCSLRRNRARGATYVLTTIATSLTQQIPIKLCSSMDSISQMASFAITYLPTMILRAMLIKLKAISFATGGAISMLGKCSVLLFLVSVLKLVSHAQVLTT